ncbi:MAG TPA: site-specific integrase [Acidimicrobiales bacterium]|nr:site-specific integrase [Acidimicrobiales bacterium]
MTGSLRQRGANSWELRVYQSTDPATGRRRYATRTVRGSRTKAQRELVELAAAANVAPIVGARTTMAELLERWFATSAPNWAPTTVRNTRSIIDRHLAPGLGSVRVRDLTTVAIDDFYSRLRTNGRHDREPLSAGTVQRVHAVLHRALAQAMRWDWIWANPAAAANKPAAEPTEMRPPTPAQINALLAHAAAHPVFHLFLVLAATTGARRGELLALRWADIDLAQGSVSIQRALVDGPSGPVLAPTKTRRPHHLDLDVRTLALLRAHHSNTHRAASGPVDRNHFVFSADPDGAVPWRPNWVTKRFITIRTGAGVGSFRLHDLRHFMATEMLNRHVPLPTVSGRLAHARMSTTLNVYAHAVPGGDRPAATLVGDLVISARTPQQPPVPLAAPLRVHACRLAPRGPRCTHRPLT